MNSVRDETGVIETPENESEDSEHPHLRFQGPGQEPSAQSRATHVVDLDYWCNNPWWTGTGWTDARDRATRATAARVVSMELTDEGFRQKDRTRPSRSSRRGRARTGAAQMARASRLADVDRRV